MSKYAYVHFVKDIHMDEVTKDGKFVHFNNPMKKGQTDLVNISEFKVLERDFPDCIKGKEIEDDNLLNMVKYCYDELKNDIEQLSTVEEDVSRRLQYISGEFERNGVLTPDHFSQSSIEDLASKVIILQQLVRKNQSLEAKHSQK